MEEEKILGLLGQGGLGALLIAVAYRIGQRFIEAMDKLVSKIEEHHKADSEHHAEVREGLSNLRTRVDVIVERADRAITPLPFRRDGSQ